jgi:hypothetical protein
MKKMWLLVNVYLKEIVFLFVFSFIGVFLWETFKNTRHLSDLSYTSELLYGCIVTTVIMILVTIRRVLIYKNLWIGINKNKTNLDQLMCFLEHWLTEKNTKKERSPNQIEIFIMILLLENHDRKLVLDFLIKRILNCENDVMDLNTKLKCIIKYLDPEKQKEIQNIIDDQKKLRKISGTQFFKIRYEL